MNAPRNAALFLSIYLVGTFSAWGCRAKEEAPPTEEGLPTRIKQTVRVAYLRIGSDLPYFVGTSKGIFTKHGLKIQGERMGESNQIVQAVLGGQVDATDITGSAPILAEALTHPEAFQVFMASAAGPNTDIHQLVARKGSGITKIEELVDKRLAVFPGTQMRVYVRLVLERYLEPAAVDRVELVPLTPPQQVQAMKEREVDAVLALEPTGTELVAAGVGDRLASNVLYEVVSKPVPFVTAFGIIRSQWARANPAAAARLLDAYREIASYIAKNPAEARQVFVTELGVDPSVASQVSLYDYAVVPKLDRAAISSSVKLMVDHGVLESAPDLGRLIYSTQ